MPKQKQNQYLVSVSFSTAAFGSVADDVSSSSADTVPVEVRVNWQTRIEDGHERMYWQRFQTTLPRYRPGSDALWKLLTRCLPFAEWH